MSGCRAQLYRMLKTILWVVGVVITNADKLLVSCGEVVSNAEKSLMDCRGQLSWSRSKMQNESYQSYQVWWSKKKGIARSFLYWIIRKLESECLPLSNTKHSDFLNRTISCQNTSCDGRYHMESNYKNAYMKNMVAASQGYS